MGSAVSSKKPSTCPSDKYRQDSSVSLRPKPLPRLPMRKEGQCIPHVTFKVRIRVAEGDDIKHAFIWKDVSTKELFEKKRIVLFAIPGAFTPVCSCDHLPGYESRFDEILKLGIDDVYCLSVNDAFVMQQWGKMQGLEEETDINPSSPYPCPLNPGNFKRVKLIPDGAAVFTREMGMSCHFNHINGYGERSWRYSAVINNMKIEKLYIEEDGAIVDDPEKDRLMVSDGGTMIHYLQQTKPNVADSVPVVESASTAMSSISSN